MKTPKSLLFLLFLTLISFSGSLFSQDIKDNIPDKSVVERYGYLSVNSTYLIDENKQPVALHGVSYGWHNWWPRFYNESTVNWLQKDWGCTVVRAAIGVESNNGYIENPDFAIQCATKIVDAAIKKGIYVIIDWHSHHIRLPQAKQFFSYMAGKYKNHPNVIYEIFNEPLDNISWKEVKSYSEEIIQVIRDEDKKNIILIGSPHWNQDIHLVADNPIKGHTNIMYTLHFYAGTHHYSLRERADYALSKQLPIFVSECAAMNADGDGPLDIKEWKTWLNWMNKNKISWASWSIADKNESSSMIKKEVSSEGNWKESELVEWGQMVRNHLREYASSSYKNNINQ